ncbi:membrane protein [Nocardioides sp. OK12]|uniref:polysaccharide pyruvyl transferase family protein n=1 Tax=Nocardioides sp. OK12 TaxID=2758661 RepID=UPI0021C3C8BB|nr:polysaccharide pyruvyl transferase family protein [Nocardioides sp. OK12]GHJ59654.1 membrane protein [Nocardioides sp. OK12]
MSGPRIGLLGRLGSGNLGNDASLEVVLDLVRRRRPDARVGVMCSGPRVVAERHAVPAVALHHAAGHGPAAWRVLVGVVVDTVRISAWVRRQDVVIVPGMGTLESTLHERAWQMPWTLFVMTLSGRLWRTRVALVAVGAGAVPEPVQRRLLVAAARMAGFRSFRDEQSREEMRRMGLRSRDPVVPDVVLALAVPERPAPPARSVGVGVMAWSGSNGERGRAAELAAAYVVEMGRVVTLLLERGFAVSLLVGDDDDVPVARQVAAAVGEDRVTLVLPTTPAELVEAVGSVEVVVATRYHNVVGALRCATPVVALCYAPKHHAVMDMMGVGELCHDLRGLEAGRLVEQVEDVHARRQAVRAGLVRRLEEVRPVLEEHLDAVAGRVLLAAPEVPA